MRRKRIGTRKLHRIKSKRKTIKRKKGGTCYEEESVKDVYKRQLEYREVSRLEELVIAIDTSGSCSTELVKQFLEETYAMISDQESFFRKMNVYVIQCDCYVQQVVRIQSEEEWMRYIENLVIEGRSGTDFRPVFQYVEKLRREKKLRRLRALFYFTDEMCIRDRSCTSSKMMRVFSGNIF